MKKKISGWWALAIGVAGYFVGKTGGLRNFANRL